MAGTAVWVLGTIINPLFRDLITGEAEAPPPRPSTWAEPDPLPSDASPNERVIFPLHLLENVPPDPEVTAPPGGGAGEVTASSPSRG